MDECEAVRRGEGGERRTEEQRRRDDWVTNDRLLPRAATADPKERSDEHETDHQHDRAVQVRPQCDDRENEQNTARGFPAVARENPVPQDEEWKREALCSEQHQRHVPREQSERAPGGGRRGGGSERSRREYRERQRRQDHRDACGRKKANPAEILDLVQPELRQPLLIDPANATRPNGELVVLREAVLHDPTAADEVEPRVLRDEIRCETREGNDQRGQDQDREEISVEPTSGIRHRGHRRREGCQATGYHRSGA